MKCIETKTGVQFGKEQSFCRPARGDHRHAHLRFMVIVSGIQCDHLTSTRDTIRSTLETSLQIPRNNLQTYYWYYRVDTEPFCYTELYFESTQGFIKGQQTYKKLTRQREQFAAILANSMHADLYVEISKAIYMIGDSYRYMGVVSGVIGVSVLVIVIVIWWLVAKRRHDEHLADLLLE